MITLYSGQVYTVADGDTIRFYPTGEEQSKLIINDILYPIWQDASSGDLYIQTGKDDPYFNNTPKIVELDTGDNYEITTAAKHIYTITLSSKIVGPPPYLQMNISLSNPACPSPAITILPAYMITELIAPVVDADAHPSGVWSDFAEIHFHWQMLKRFEEMGLICPNDVPGEPKIEDYL